jgi:peroxiredoxin
MADIERPPAWSVSAWLNTDKPLSLPDLAGKVVVLHAFQMLCPGCVQHGLPQMQRLARQFSRETVAVIGLHTVFEHKEAMTPTALKAFVHEYKIDFPIGIDEPIEDEILPKTMAAYRMQGTPTLLVYDKQGRLRRHYFGKPEDLMLGAEIMGLVVEEDARKSETMMARALVSPDHGHEHTHGDDCGCGHEHHHH